MLYRVANKAAQPEHWVTKDRHVAVAWIAVLEDHKDVVCPISLCQNDRLLSSLSNSAFVES
jgi:hypothetical protein